MGSCNKQWQKVDSKETFSTDIAFSIFNGKRLDDSLHLILYMPITRTQANKRFSTDDVYYLILQLPKSTP